MKANQTSMKSSQTAFGPLQIGILLLGLVTAIVHLVILNLLIYNSQGHIDVLFTLNGLGYLALLAAYFLPIPIAQNNRGLVRWIFIGYTILTIVAWVAMGEPSALSYITKIVEVALVVLLWLDRR
jgi:hypothetical protein